MTRRFRIDSGRILTGLIVLLVQTGGAAYGEAPGVQGLFPAGIRQGETTTVTLVGKPGSEPLETWCSRDDLVLTPTNKAAEWILTAAADAPAGLRWVRFYNAEGASKLQPVVVGLLPEATETESNDAVSAAHELPSLPLTVNGRLNKSGDVDTFSFNLEAGQTLIASVDAHRLLGSPMDAVLQLLSPRGFVLEQVDDHHGNDPRIVFKASQAGTYYVRMFAFPADPNSSIQFSSSDRYIYRLTLTTGPYVDHVEPLALSAVAPSPPVARGWNLPDEGLSLTTSKGPSRSDVSLAAPTNFVLQRLPRINAPALLEDVLTAETEPPPLSIPVSVTGRIGQPDEVDSYQFTGRKDQRVVISAESRACDSPLDPYLKIFGPDGKLLKEADDNSRSDSDATITIALPADGTYRAEIRDRFGHGDAWSMYLFSITEDEPRYELTLPDDPLTLEGGKSLDVAVTVNRSGGFDKEVTVRLLDAPPGVRVSEVRSQPSGDSAKTVTLKLEADADTRFSGPVRVIGSVEDGDSVIATTAAPVAELRMDSIWLTVTAPKASK